MIEWLKKNWYVPVFFIVVLLLSFKPRRFKTDRRRNHHGVNKYGERY